MVGSVLSRVFPSRQKSGSESQYPTLANEKEHRQHRLSEMAQPESMIGQVDSMADTRVHIQPDSNIKPRSSLKSAMMLNASRKDSYASVKEDSGMTYVSLLQVLITNRNRCAPVL